MPPRSFILLFLGRLLRREWPKYALAFLSLLVTSLTLTVVLVGVEGARGYLSDRSREFVGGDLALESGNAIDPDRYLAPLAPYIAAADREVSLALTVRSGERVTAVSARAVSEAFPLYGVLEIAGDTYAFPAPDEAYADPVVLERLGLAVGDTLFIGDIPYRIRGVIVREPDALVQGFRFAPRLIFSEAGLARSGLALGESRSDYEYRYRLKAETPRALLENAVQAVAAAGIETRVAGDGQSGLLRRLDVVENFFLITVIIGALLSAVNVYANATTLVARLRKTFAVLLVEGASRRALIILVLGLIGVITLLATALGAALGLGLVGWLYRWIATTSQVQLAVMHLPASLALVFFGTCLTSLAATVPAMRDLLALQPRDLLSGALSSGKRRLPFLTLLFLSLAAFGPLFLVAVFLLADIRTALAVVGGTTALFMFVALSFGSALSWAYRQRQRCSFFIRSLLAEKYADGIFGIVATTSLFIALASIFSLSLLERSVENFFATGIGATIPSAYFIDVQTDQVDRVRAIVPGVTLFPNVRARILRIDDRAIQERLQAKDTDEDRELGREFNLTYRRNLLDSERITSGAWPTGDGRGEVSVEQDFARRAGIRLGSSLTFAVQGVPLAVRVTSLRSAETTSGLPFFYFVLAPADLERFPASLFGYVEIAPEKLRAVEADLAKAAPNVSVLDTTAIGETVRSVTSTVLSLLAVITLPPLLLATLLLMTLVAATFAGRQRDAVRLQVLGATRSFTLLAYLVETALTVIIAGIGAAGLALGVVAGVTEWVLEGVQPVFWDWKILWILGALLGALLVYTLLLLWLRRLPLLQTLAYEENI